MIRYYPYRENRDMWRDVFIYASNDMKFHVCAVRWANIDKISVDSGIVGGE
jgi:hypothetical protein